MIDICVCAEPLEERSKFPCGHSLCLSCTLKKRVLMKDYTCPYCRTYAKNVYVVNDSTMDTSKAQQSFNPGDLKVETKELVTKLRHILNFACPECDVENKTYKALKQHIQDEHSRTLCDVCTKHEFIFSDEFQLIPFKKVKEHLKAKHIYCRYCNNYHYSSSEFLKHCRERHIGCAVCERINPELPLYFKSYDELKTHYIGSHYMCMVPECLENKHIVFQTEMELQKHMVDTHRGLLTNVRRAQKVDISQLTLDTGDNQGGMNQYTASGSRAASEAAEDIAAVERKKKLDAERLNRYQARLSLAANHDAEKVKQLEAANTTFIKKNVPVSIFFATYESVLSGTPAPEITALLVAFKNAYSENLSDKSLQALQFAVNTRLNAEQVRNKTDAKGTDNDNGKKSRAPAPAAADMQKYSWGLAVPRAGGVKNVAELPMLGGNKKPSNNRVTVSSPATWGARGSSSSGSKPLLRSLPTLAKKAPQVGGALHSERQTSIPLRDSLNRNPYAYSGPRTVTPAASRSDHSTTSSGTPSASSSVGNLGSRVPPQSRQSALTNLQLSNLPTLARATDSKEDQSTKKKKRAVIRMV